MRVPKISEKVDFAIALSNRLSEKNAFYNWYHNYNKKEGEFADFV